MLLTTTSRARLAGYAAWCIAVATSSGCGTETKPSIDAVISEDEPGLGRRLDTVRLIFTRISTGEGRVIDRAAAYDGERLQSITIRLTPDDGSNAGELYRVRAEGLVGSEAIVTVQHRIAFVAGQRLVLPMRFAPECVGTGCSGESTCVRGTCVSDLEMLCAAGDAPPEVCAGRDAGAVEDTSPATDSDAADLGSLPPDVGPPDVGPMLDAGCECDDGLACTDDRCEPDVGCISVPRDDLCGRAGSLCIPPDGCVQSACSLDADCDDGDACSQEACVRGSCARAPIACPGVGIACQSVGCDPVTGCTRTPAIDGTRCDGGTCCGGTCVTGFDETSCGACGIFCPGTVSCIRGACSSCLSASDCDDGLDCTTDGCASGVCTNALMGSAGCLIGGVCVDGLATAPGNDCLNCNPMVSRTSWYATHVARACDDGLYCTAPGTCADGACVGVPLDCSDGEICTIDRCNEDRDRCEHEVAPGHCFIDEVCRGARERHPIDECLECNPTLSTGSWSRRPGC